MGNGNGKPPAAASAAARLLLALAVVLLALLILRWYPSYAHAVDGQFRQARHAHHAVVTG